MGNFKKLLKINALRVRILLRRVQFSLFGTEKKFQGMSNSAIFNKIYEEGIWGKNIDGESISGVGSHSENIIQPYILEVSKFLLAVKPKTIVDLGCGDFNVGKNFVKFCEHYIACDVAGEILSVNEQKFISQKNTTFKLLDLTEEPLPKGDVCFVRQVLQHLSNSDIKNFVKNLQSQRPYKYLIVTEDVPLWDNFAANAEKPTGASTRLVSGSGIVLHKEPFNLDASNNSDLLQVQKNRGRVKTTIYEF